MSEQIFGVNCGFFDSINGDRKYSANEMNKPFKRLITNGVFATPQGTPSTDLQVLSAGSGMNIVVKAGYGMFGDKWFDNATDLVITVPTNTTTAPRRDSVIVQVDKRNNGRTGSIVYRTGIPDSNPMPPDIGTVANVVEYRVANVYVAASASVINQDAITDLRGSEECPWVTSLIEQVDTSTLFTQYQNAYQNYYNTSTTQFNNYKQTSMASFDAWQASEKEAFEEFMRGLTQELTVNTNIAILESSFSTVGQTSQIPINIAGFDKAVDALMVFVNGFKVHENTYYTISNDSLYINLTTPLSSGQTVNFTALKSLVNPDERTTIQMITQVSEKLTEVSADSGWINFTLENGAQSFDETSVPACRKVGDRVFIRGAVKNVTATNTTICTLPVAFRPAQNFIFAQNMVGDGAVVAICTMEVTTSGEVKVIAIMGTLVETGSLSIATNFIVG